MPEPIEPTPAPVTPPADEGAVVTPPVPEVKPAEAKPVEKPAGSEPEKKVVPEKYDLKLPKDSLLDPVELENVSKYAKANGLTNEEAQDILEGESARMATHVDSQKEKWSTEWKNDEEIGGADFQKNVELAKRVVDRFGDESLKSDLNRFGYGNHPGLGRMLVKLGKAMSEDQLVMPGAVPAGAEKKSTAEVFYPSKKE